MLFINSVVQQVKIWVLLAYLISHSFVVNGAEVAIIIDDMGNGPRDSEAFKLPSQIAFSILPHTSLSTDFSKRASHQRREVMLHIPMESLGGKALGPGAIIQGMDASHIRRTLSHALASVPHAIGVNNHMGSKLTQLVYPMEVTMEFLQERGLFFVDSRTTHHSQAQMIATQKGVLNLKRNVFIDHNKRFSNMPKEFLRLIQLAKKYGYAVGIAHPYPETIEYLMSALPQLEAHNVRLTPVTQLLQSQQLTRQDNHIDKNTAVQ